MTFDARNGSLQSPPMVGKSWVTAGGPLTNVEVQPMRDFSRKLSASQRPDAVSRQAKRGRAALEWVIRNFADPVRR